MLDTIKLRYSLQSDAQLNLLVEWFKEAYNESFQEIINGDGSSYYRCKINNLIVSVSSEYLVIRGSINKLWMGNNVQSLEMNDIPLAIEYLNTSLNNIVDIRKAKVRRLDFGRNVAMNYKPTAYISKLHSSSIKPSSFYNGQTINTGNNSRGMIFYDKTEEANSDKAVYVLVPSNLLRVEVKYIGRHVFEKHFGNPLPRLSDILHQLNKLPDIWYEEYKKIDKQYNSTIVDRISNQNDLFRYTISKAGFAECVNIINYSYQLGTLNSQNRYRYYQLVSSVFNSSMDTNTDDLMRELDEKVLMVYQELKGNA